MSNASNLSNLANVLDDGTSGQVLTSQGSGVVAFADAASGTGVTVHNNQAAMLTDAASADEGSLHYENANNKLYVKQSSGFFLLASITNTAPTVSGFTETTGSGSANTILDNGTFALTSGSNTVITLTATDPDLETLVYSATVTSGTASNVISSPSLPISNQSGNTFTLTPVTSGAGGEITIRFDVSDGNNVVNKTHSFSLTFQVVDSKYTTLLATATSIGGNSTIEDSSSANSGSGHNITVTGDTYAGSFSPYRSGGYSTYLENNTDYYRSNSSSDFDIGGTGDWSYEAWVYPTNLSVSFPRAFGLGPYYSDPKSFGVLLQDPNNGGYITVYWSPNTRHLISSTTVPLNSWSHIMVCRSGNDIGLFFNGTRIAHNSNYTASIPTGNTYLFAGATGNNNEGLIGYIKDVRFINGSHPYDASSASFNVPTEALEITSNTKFLGSSGLPYIKDISTSNHSITVNGDVTTKPLSPYDYEEYDSADHGGSLYFNGTNSAVQIADNDDFDFGTGDLTIECWVYPEVTSNSYPGFLGTSAGWGSVAASGFRFDNLGDSKFQMSWYGPGDPFLETQSTYKHNEWYHFVVTRTGGSTWRMFVNGILEDTGTNSTAYDISIGGNNLQVGGKTWDGGNGWFKGNVADLRLTKGSVVSEYQTTSTTVGTKIFTPRTSPISSSGSELHLKGTDASIIDKSQGANLKLVGNTTGSTTQAKFSNTKSMYFDGTGDYLTLPQITLGSGNFTIEAWTYLESRATTYPAIFSNYSSFSAGSLGLFAGHGSSTTTNYQVAHNGSGFPAINAGTVSYDQWVHLALVRNNGTITLYKDGTSIGSFTSSADLSGVGSNFYIGAAGDGISTSYIDGYIQDFRITNGLARYTANFTPPSAPLEG